jgi:Tol biopolymer transport system component
VVRLPVVAQAPDWSPDGRRLAFTRRDGVGIVTADEPGEIYVANVDGTGLRRITHNTANERDDEVRWWPDGRELLFVRNQSTVYMVGATGGAPKELVTRGTVSSVSWAPDGQKIAYMVPSKIHIFTLATRTGRAFTPSPCLRVDPDRYESCSSLDWRPVLR